MKATVIYANDNVALFLNGKLTRTYPADRRDLLDSFLDGIVYTTGHEYMIDEKDTRTAPELSEMKQEYRENK